MIVKHNPNCFPPYLFQFTLTFVVQENGYLSPFSSVHTHRHNISIRVEKCKLVQYVFLSASDTENQGFVCVCEMPLCILGPFTFWSQCFLIYLYLNSSYTMSIILCHIGYIYIPVCYILLNNLVFVIHKCHSFFQWSNQPFSFVMSYSVFKFRKYFQNRTDRITC